MKKGTSVTLRFCIYSEVEDKNRFLQLINRMPKGYGRVTYKGERIMLTTGKLSGVVPKSSSFNYCKVYNNIFNVEDCNKSFISDWRSQKSNLQKLHDEFDVDFVLDYEIVIYNSQYPSFVFYKDFIKFLSSINCGVTHYFYEG